jgi:hypothetical protein
MHWAEIKRRLGILVGGWALLLATAFGGGDKNPSGSGGGGDSATYDLVALGHAGLPADTQPEDCTETRLYSGGLKVNANGTWQIKPEVHDESGDWGYEDEGRIEQNGATVSFDSQISGSSYQGTVDNTGVSIMYDWCYNGVPDVQLVFE